MRKIPFILIPSESGTRQPIHAYELAEIVLLRYKMIIRGELKGKEKILLGGDHEITYEIMIKKILSLLGAFVSLHKNEKTINEFTDLIIAKHNFKRENPHYQQVFQYKHGFINNLSVMDLLFNLGPQSLEYLEQVKTDFISTRVMQK